MLVRIIVLMKRRVLMIDTVLMHALVQAVMSCL
jgi:hypothetical protein